MTNEPPTENLPPLPKDMGSTLPPLPTAMQAPVAQTPMKKPIVWLILIACVAICGVVDVWQALQSEARAQAEIQQNKNSITRAEEGAAKAQDKYSSLVALSSRKYALQEKLTSLDNRLRDISSQVRSAGDDAALRDLRRVEELLLERKKTLEEQL